MIIPLQIIFRDFPVLDVVVSEILDDPEQEAARVHERLFLRLAKKMMKLS